MPLVVVAIHPAISCQQVKDEIDRRMRDEIYDAACFMGEEAKIQLDKDFMVVVSDELEREDVLAEVTLVMFPREEARGEAYRHAAHLAMHKATPLLDKQMDVRFYGAPARHWTGSLSFS